MRIFSKIGSPALTAAGVCGFLILAAPALRASTIYYYGGDPQVFFSYGGTNYYYLTYDMVDTGPAVNSDQLYDNFLVPANQTVTVTGFYALIGDPDPSNPNPLADWDVRTNLSATSLGTDVASGTSTTATTTWTTISQNLNGEPSFDLAITLTTPLTLTGGPSGTTYWFNVAPLDPNYYNLFVGLDTTHGNAVGQPLDDDSLLVVNSSTMGNSIQPQNFDASMGVLTGGVSTASAPEPATFVLVGAVLMGLGLIRRRRAC
jgi:PEP-CTERM motif